MTGKTKNGSARVVIVGGGVAGIETLLALADLGGDRVSQTLVSPRPDFLYKPLLVEEPFDIGPAERYELQPLAEEKGASFTQRAVSGVRKADHQVELDDGSTLEYDFLIVCVGALRPGARRRHHLSISGRGLPRRFPARPGGRAEPSDRLHRPGGRDLVTPAL
jgi:thioredoxin reductase